MKKFVWVIVLLMIMCSACNKNEETVIKGEPDVVNSTIYNQEYHLNLIANRNQIDDKWKFAEEVIQMCKDNSFRTIRFSYDLGYPTGVYIEVYLNEEDFQNGKIIMEITYCQEDESSGYDIINNPEEFELMVGDETV